MKYLVKVTTVDEVKNYEVLYVTNSNALPRGGHYIFVESEIKLSSPIISTDEEGKLILVEDPAKEKEARITDAYNSMVKDVYDQMQIVFGTRNDVSASAFAATFEAMLKRPSSYIDATLGFNDEATVTAYATSKIIASDEYGVFRMKRIAQFESEKQTILGE